jgi:hypothetical protein
MNSLNWFYRVIISLIILAFIYYIVLLNPSYIILPLILNKWPKSEYPLDRTYAIEKSNYTLYKGSNNNGLLICFNGGAFVYSKRQYTYGLLNTLFSQLQNANAGVDILVFDYPVRFKYTVNQTMKSINTLLKSFVLQYEKFYGLGISAGCLLLAAIINNENSARSSKMMELQQIGLSFSGIVLIDGVLSTDFGSQLLNRLFHFYIMRGTPGVAYYTMYGFPQIRKMVITTTHDELYIQSKKFIKSEPIDVKLVYDKRLIHGFPRFINLPESQEAITKMCSFILQLTNKK